MQLLDAVQPLLVDFIAKADRAGSQSRVGGLAPTSSQNFLLDHVEPRELQRTVLQDLPKIGKGQAGVVEILQHILRYSTNTWHQGFMDKLYGSTNPVGVATELILAVLHTNVRAT